MACSLLDITRSSIKKAGQDACEPSDVLVRALLLAKIAENEGEGDSIDEAKNEETIDVSLKNEDIDINYP